MSTGPSTSLQLCRLSRASSQEDPEQPQVRGDAGAQPSNLTRCRLPAPEFPSSLQSLLVGCALPSGWARRVLAGKGSTEDSGHSLLGASWATMLLPGRPCSHGAHFSPVFCADPSQVMMLKKLSALLGPLGRTRWGKAEGDTSLCARGTSFWNSGWYLHPWGGWAGHAQLAAGVLLPGAGTVHRGATKSAE